MPLYNIGNNNIKIIVTAEDGITKKTYTINAYRETIEEEEKREQEEVENAEKLNQIMQEQKNNIGVDDPVRPGVYHMPLHFLLPIFIILLIIIIYILGKKYLKNKI